MLSFALCPKISESRQRRFRSKSNHYFCYPYLAWNQIYSSFFAQSSIVFVASLATLLRLVALQVKKERGETPAGFRHGRSRIQKISVLLRWRHSDRCSFLFPATISKSMQYWNVTSWTQCFSVPSRRVDLSPWILH